MESKHQLNFVITETRTIQMDVQTHAQLLLVTNASERQSQSVLPSVEMDLSILTSNAMMATSYQLQNALEIVQVQHLAGHVQEDLAQQHLHARRFVETAQS